MTKPTALILLPRLRVQNANAISGPLSWGFPPPTAFTGFTHALERKISKKFGGVGIICHRFEPQVSGKWDKVFCLTRNPVGKDGKPPSFVEEGRVHIEISLVVALHDDSMTKNEGAYFAEDVMTTAMGMRIAGGSILPQREGGRYEARYWRLSDTTEDRMKEFQRYRRRLVPGFALVRRNDVLSERLLELQKQNMDANTLDALMDISRLNWEPDRPNPDRSGETRWGVRPNAGWLVPIPVGYAAISPLYKSEEVSNTRDAETPFRFVETLYGVGEWVSPHRVEELEQLLWYHDADVEKGIYQCKNDFSKILGNI